MNKIGLLIVAGVLGFSWVQFNIALPNGGDD